RLPNRPAFDRLYQRRSLANRRNQHQRTESFRMQSPNQTSDPRRPAAQRAGSSAQATATPPARRSSRPLRGGPAPRLSAPETQQRIRLRTYFVGLMGTVLVDLWIHWAELVLGGTRGHSAMANTSIPLGAFCALFILVLINQSLHRTAPRWALEPAEML